MNKKKKSSPDSRKVLLTCSACGQPTDRLYSRSYCKACNCAKTTERQRRFKAACLNYAGTACPCGERRQHLLCFAQKDARAKLVSLSSKGVALSDEVRQQLDSCRVVCRNCYYAQKNPTASEKKRALVAFLGGECRYCGERRFSALEFHHIDPSTKSFEIGSHEMRRKSLTSLVEEAAKCQLLCGNCHANEHVEGRSLTYGSLQQAWELESELKQLSQKLGEVQK